MSKVIVVGSARYPVCLDSGRHLQPGEVVEIEDSVSTRQRIADGQLRILEPAKAEPVTKSEPATGTKPDRTQEV